MLGKCKRHHDVACGRLRHDVRVVKETDLKSVAETRTGSNPVHDECFAYFLFVERSLSSNNSHARRLESVGLKKRSLAVPLMACVLISRFSVGALQRRRGR